jgi:hypothetical protein
MALTILQRPSDPDQPPFSDFKDDKLSDMHRHGFVGAGEGDRRDPRFGTFFVPVVNALAGLANTILSATYTGLEKNGDWKLAIAATVIGNVSYVIAPLAPLPLPGLSEDLSVGLKTLVDGLANVTAQS